MQRSEIAIGRRFHGEQGDDLKKVVLDHVAQAAGGLVERAAPLDAEVLGQRDLNAGHVVAVPDRLQEGVGKAEVEEVHDLLLAEEVVDAVDRILSEHRSRYAVEVGC